MKIRLLQIGKTSADYLETGISEYKKRLSHYINCEEITLRSPAAAKGKSENEQKRAEGEMIQSALKPGEKLILLDEGGKEFSSTGLAEFFKKEANQATRSLVFVIGGPFGFSEELIRKADLKLSFSKMTFSHQMIRLFFWEQMYRAHTIIKGEKYHHE
jgi:23S rRNA (pseudouridine1915-N3)-methyltransferase